MKQSITALLLLFALQAVSQIPNTLTNAEKVYGLSRFWQEVNYNFAYLHTIDREAWDAAYLELIEEVQQTSNDYEFYRMLQMFAAMLKDGHTNVYFPKAIQEKIYNTYFGEYRLFLTNIDGRAIITRVNQSKKDEIPPGTEVLKVNGMPMEDYRKQFVVPYIASSTDYIVDDWSIMRLLEAPEGTTFELGLKLPDGSLKTLILTHTETTEKEVYPPFEDQSLLDLKWMNDVIAYVALNSFDNPRIDTLFWEKLPELYKAKGLIIDLRNNGGGNTAIGYEILQYLTKDNRLYGSRQVTRNHLPTFKAWGAWVQLQDTIGDEWAQKAYLAYHDAYFYEFPTEPEPVNPKGKRIVVPTVLLIGHQTASAAEDFLIAADKMPHMTRIGEPTFGSTGQPLFFDLPGGGSARVCTKIDTYPDGRPFVGVGIQPDILVKPTLQDYLEQRDAVLERAMIFLSGKIKD